MKHKESKSGFPLGEILIVIVALVVWAMIIVPRITVSGGDARLGTLQSDLSVLRSVLEIYYVQHGGRYPGETDATGAPNTDAAEAARSMLAQLTGYSDVNGRVSDVRSETFRYGPYLRGGSLPENPFNSLSTVQAESTGQVNAPRTGDDSDGWVYRFRTGVIFADTPGYENY